MENFNGDREGYMRSLDNTAEVMRRERNPNVYDLNNSSRFDRREDDRWATRGHGHNSYEQQFNRHYGAEPTPRFPESGANYDVKGVHSGKGPKSYRRSDDRLKEIICERLTADPNVDASDLEIEVKNGEVTLIGSVSDKSMKRQAEDVVESVTGITHVENKIRINKSFF
jgi:hypothetical protein